MKPVSERYQRSKIITFSYVIVAITLCAFALGKIFLPEGESDPSIPSIIDSVAFVGFGLSVSMSMALYGYQAWALDSESFGEWYSYQQIIRSDGFQEWYKIPEGWNLRSQYRLLGPLGLLAGLAIAGLGFAMLVT